MGKGERGSIFYATQAAVQSRIFLCALALAAVVCLVQHAKAAPKRVLILQAYNYTFPATTIAAEAARKRLVERSPEGIDLEVEFLDLARRPSEADTLSTANYLQRKYAAAPFDLVLAVGVAAVPFIQKYRQMFAAGVPVVFAGGTRADYDALRAPADITGVFMDLNLNKTLALAQSLQPNARQLVVIAGNSKMDIALQKLAHEALDNGKTSLRTIYWVNEEYEQLLDKVAKLPRDTIVALMAFYTDARGKNFIPAESAGAIAQASNAPVYGLFETYIGKGVVGGFVDTFESLGVAAADMAIEVLTATGAHTLPPRINPRQSYQVDARALERWGLQLTNLPQDSVVLYSTPSFWRQYRTLIISVILGFSAQTIIVILLLVHRYRRQQAEASFAESEERMSFTAAAANIGLWQLQPETKELWATDHCRKMFGIAPDAPFDKNTILAAIHPDDRNYVLKQFREWRSATDPATVDVRIILPDNQTRWIRLRAQLQTDNHRSRKQISGIFVDVTAQKAAEADAALQRQEVTHLMRVSVLGELSGAIAHEINQPLTAILSNAQAALFILGANTPDLDEVRDALEEIVFEDSRAGEVIQRLRNLLKKGQSVSEAVNINDLVNATVTLLRSEFIGRQVAVELDLATELPITSGDPVQLQQVLLNLIINAMDAMKSTPLARRRVGISTRGTAENSVEISVTDNGSGINACDKARIWEPFYSTKDHGLGLGLTICSTIVRAHGGELRLFDHDTGGTVAAFTLSPQKMLVAAQ